MENKDMKEIAWKMFTNSTEYSSSESAGLSHIARAIVLAALILADKRSGGDQER